MGLINLRTNLKDLKFGNDESGGGSSKQPFIQTRIPATDEPLQTSPSLTGNNIAQGLGSIALSAGAGAAIGSIIGPAGTIAGAIAGTGIGLAGAISTQDFSLGLRIPTAGTGGPDFLIRGGLLLPNIIANDAIRLTKYFASTEGILFTVKQNLLSRLAVKTQYSPTLLNDGIYTPISTLSQVVGNAFGLHVNKQGLNPFLGTGESYTPNKYFSTIADETIRSNTTENYLNNRLYALYTIKIADIGVSPEYYIKNNISDSSISLLSYSGGPNSFLGIGKTNIPLATNNTGAPLSTNNPSINSYSILALTQQDIYNIPTKDKPEDGSPAYVGLISVNNLTIDQRINDGTGNSNSIGDFRKKLKAYADYALPNYSEANIERRTKLGNPGGIFRFLENYSEGNNAVRFNPTNYGAAAANDFSSYDKINAYPIYNSTNNGDEDNLKDLVNFRIGIINNDTPNLKTYIHFRAFLDQISDNYSSNWDPTKYIGRGENFYTYSGFDRKVSLGWTVAAQSKAELIPMYRKLNYLASICAPDYSEEGYMRGNIVQLTIGGYFYEQPGIITGFNYEMNNDTDTGEIALGTSGGNDATVKQLPHLIRVTGFNFTPIHRFVPRKQQFSGNSTLIPIIEDPAFTTYGPERYISLQDSINNLYGNSYYNT